MFKNWVKENKWLKSTENRSLRPIRSMNTKHWIVFSNPYSFCHTQETKSN